MEVQIAKEFYKGEPEDFFSYCRKSHGITAAKVIEKRLSHIRAALDLSVLMQQGFPGRWHWLTGQKREHQISADFDRMMRLIFLPMEDKELFMDLGGTGNLDNKKVKGLIFVEIADTHNE